MTEQKRLLVLGGSPFQVPLIEKAKALGLYVITCDYLPDNPGHALADEYYDASTTDKEAVLEVAKRCRADAITSFCSDPAVPTVAYVAEVLGLPGPSLVSVEMLTEKDKFRGLMKSVGLNVPTCYTVKEGELPSSIESTQNYIVKPVDSSGSKGITKSSGEIGPLKKAVDYALQFSRAGRCIIEEFIDGKQVHGDAFVKDGKLIYYYLGDHYFFTGTNSFIPISTRWPANISAKAMHSVVEQAEKLVQAAGYLQGPINIEARIGSDDKAYIIEIGPRNGGNFVPIIQQRLSGFDFTKSVINLALGKQEVSTSFTSFSAGAHYILHAEKGGKFSGVTVGGLLGKCLFFKKVFKNKGDEVKTYTGSNHTIGVLLFDFEGSEFSDMATCEIFDLIDITADYYG